VRLAQRIVRALITKRGHRHLDYRNETKMRTFLGRRCGHIVKASPGTIRGCGLPPRVRGNWIPDALGCVRCDREAVREAVKRAGMWEVPVSALCEMTGLSEPRVVRGMRS
jgi:hypothetical protein